MTDPDERIINRALMYLEDDDEAIAEHRENARAALHRLFRDRRRLEAEVERLRAVEGRYCALADHHDEAHEKCASRATLAEKPRSR
jgi:hypothetical protein